MNSSITWDVPEKKKKKRTNKLVQKTTNLAVINSQLTEKTAVI